jgi:hypothetical protein
MWDQVLFYWSRVVAILDLTEHHSVSNDQFVPAVEKFTHVRTEMAEFGHRRWAFVFFYEAQDYTKIWVFFLELTELLWEK